MGLCNSTAYWRVKESALPSHVRIKSTIYAVNLVHLRSAERVALRSSRFSLTACATGVDTRYINWVGPFLPLVTGRFPSPLPPHPSSWRGRSPSLCFLLRYRLRLLWRASALSGGGHDGLVAFPVGVGSRRSPLWRGSHRPLLENAAGGGGHGKGERRQAVGGILARLLMGGRLAAAGDCAGRMWSRSECGCACVGFCHWGRAAVEMRGPHERCTRRRRVLPAAPSWRPTRFSRRASSMAS